MCAYCSCAAGLGQTCNHVAGMLFRVEHANKSGLAQPSCTSLPCTWDVPSEKVSYGPQPLKEMLLKKSRHGKSDKKRPLVSKSKKVSEPISSNTSNYSLASLADALADVVPDACLFKGYSLITEEFTSDTKEASSSEDTEIPEDKINLMEHAEKFSPGQFKQFYTTVPKLTSEEICKVSNATSQQSSSALWHKARKGRITASMCYAVYTKVNTMKKSTASDPPDTTSLLNSLMGRTNISDKLPKAMKHGVQMESYAKENFITENKRRHIEFKAENCGLFMHPEKPFLAASPDMTVSCSCCRGGVVEIKCPLLPPCKKCQPHLCTCSGNLKYLIQLNGKLSLKKNHSYYGQIQCQLAVTGKKYCDFYVYTDSSSYQERILPDKKFWDIMYENLEYFYVNYMIPEMFSTVQKVTGEPEPMEVDDEIATNEEIAGNVYFCPFCWEQVKEKENIRSFQERSICCDKCNMRYHFKCIKMTKAKLNCLRE